MVKFIVCRIYIELGCNLQTRHEGEGLHPSIASFHCNLPLQSHLSQEDAGIGASLGRLLVTVVGYDIYP